MSTPHIGDFLRLCFSVDDTMSVEKTSPSPVYEVAAEVVIGYHFYAYHQAETLTIDPKPLESISTGRTFSNSFDYFREVFVITLPSNKGEVAPSARDVIRNDFENFLERLIPQLPNIRDAGKTSIGPELRGSSRLPLQANCHCQASSVSVRHGCFPDFTINVTPSYIPTACLI